MVGGAEDVDSVGGCCGGEGLFQLCRFEEDHAAAAAYVESGLLEERRGDGGEDFVPDFEFSFERGVEVQGGGDEAGEEAEEGVEAEVGL